MLVIVKFCFKFIHHDCSKRDGPFSFILLFEMMKNQYNPAKTKMIFFYNKHVNVKIDGKNVYGKVV